MKKVILITTLVLLFASAVYAAWEVDFEDNYFDLGIDQAVVLALEDGAKPYGIIDRGLDLEGLNPQNLIQALFCGGAESDEIRDAAEKHKISPMIVTAGYKKSIVECTDALADSQAYTPVSTGTSGGRSGGGSGGTYVSGDRITN